jgi:hypothetical protein
MYKLQFILYFSFLFHYSAHYQSIKSKIIDKVKKYKNVENIQIVGGGISKIDSFFYDGNSNGDFEFLNNNGAIWLTQNGSSRVYKIDSNGVIKRLDRTFNQGFNYGATNLIYNDTLYSIGGYGFWQTTGSVRYFNTNSGEWDIIRNIENVPVAGGINAFCYYDKTNGKLFVIYTPTVPEYLKNKGGDVKEQALLQCFDFKEKRWWDEAKKLNPNIATKYSDLTFIQKFGKDILMSSKLNGKVLLVNLNENKIKEVDYKYHTEFQQLINDKKHYISYTVNDTVNILDLDNDTTYKNYIKPSQLNTHNESLYSNTIIPKDLKGIPLLTISVIINILLLSIFVGFKMQINKTQLKEEKNEAVENNVSEKDNRSFKYYVQNLSTIEKDLLQLLYNNNLTNQNTTVTQINKVLGTEKKPFKIQNNIRGEVLTTMNNKFMAFASVSNNLIERQRSEYDKRHMEYFINEKYISKLSIKIFQV